MSAIELWRLDRFTNLDSPMVGVCMVGGSRKKKGRDGDAQGRKRDGSRRTTIRADQKIGQQVSSSEMTMIQSRGVKMQSCWGGSELDGKRMRTAKLEAFTWEPT